MGHFHICIQVKNRCLKAYGQVTWSNLSICFAEKRVIPNAYGEVTWSYLHVCFATIKRGTSVTLRFYWPPAGRNGLGRSFPQTVLRYCQRIEYRSGRNGTHAGVTCTYAFRYLMGCFDAVSASTLAQNEAEKIYKKSKNVLHYCEGCIILFIYK